MFQSEPKKINNRPGIDNSKKFSEKNDESHNTSNLKDRIVYLGKKTALFIAKKYGDRKYRIAQEVQTRKINKINEVFFAIEQNKHAMHPSLFSDISNFRNKNIENIDILSAYFLTKETNDFLTALKAFRQDIAQDELSYHRTHNFSAYINVLFDALGQAKVQNRLDAIAKSYHVKASSNTILTGVLAAQNRNGMALLSAAEGISNSYKAGAHNGEMNSIICDFMRFISVSQSVADLNDAHAFYIRAASRLMAVNKNREISNKAYFSLIFNNSNCKVSFPGADPDSRKIAWHEFNNNFSQYIWSPSEAAAHIDSIKNNDSKIKELIEGKDLKSYINNYYFNGKQRENIAAALSSKT